MSLPQARETSTAYRQTDWSQYISCIRYRIAWLPGGSGFGAVLHPVIVVVLKLLVVDRCPTRISSIFYGWLRTVRFQRPLVLIYLMHASLGSFGRLRRRFTSTVYDEERWFDESRPRITSLDTFDRWTVFTNFIDQVFSSRFCWKKFW